MKFNPENIISIASIIIGLIVTTINIVFAGKIKTLTLVAENRFKQFEKLSDKAVESLQEIVYCLRKLKEIYKYAHVQFTIVSNKNEIAVINEVSEKLHKFNDEFINSFSRGEIFLSKTLRNKLYQIDYQIKRPSVNIEKLEELIKNIEIGIDDICDFTKEVYFNSSKELIEK